MKKIKDLTLKEIQKICKKNNDCCKCPLLDICGMPFGSIDNKRLKEDFEDD